MTTKAKIKELKFTAPIVVRKDTIGFHAYSPALKGLHMGGDTEQEALDNARSTARDFLEIMLQDGIPIPLSVMPQDEQPGLVPDRDCKGYYTEEIVISLQ